MATNDKSTADYCAVKFDHAEGGELNLSGSHTMPDLLAVGALTHTARYVSPGKYQFATDVEGIRRARESLEATRTTIAVGVASVGRLMTFAADEMTTDVASGIGSLLWGLGETVCVSMTHCGVSMMRSS